MGRPARIAALTWLLLFQPAVSAAQTPSALIDRGIRAYNDLDFSSTAGLMRSALVIGRDSLPVPVRVRALTYLGAAEVLNDALDSAEAAFQRLILLDPTAIIDELLFPPEITSVFRRVKERTKVVRLELPDSVELQVAGDRLTGWAFASSVHPIEASVRSADGRTVRILYRGLIGDSLPIAWDGRDASNVPVSTGSYMIAVESRDLAQRALRVTQVPMDISLMRPESLPPLMPPDSLLLPERSAAGPGLEAAIGGLMAGTAVVVLPRLLAPDAGVGGARFAVAGAVSLSGIGAFLAHRPGQPLSANIAHNDTVRLAWERRRRAMGAGTLEDGIARMAIRFGPAVTIDLQAR